MEGPQKGGKDTVTTGKDLVELFATLGATNSALGKQTSHLAVKGTGLESPQDKANAFPQETQPIRLFAVVLSLVKVSFSR